MLNAILWDSLHCRGAKRAVWSQVRPLSYLDLDMLVRVGCDAGAVLSAAESEYEEEPTAAGPLAKLYEQIMRVLLAVSSPSFPCLRSQRHQQRDDFLHVIRET